MRAGLVRTDTILDEIVAHKAEEVAARKERRPHLDVTEAARQAPPPRDMLSALCKPRTVALIAEVKHASPHSGLLIDPFDPVMLARTYADNGAAAVSVLTDERFFGGHLDHLAAVRREVNVPVLQKDFIFHEYQVLEGRAVGADTIPLIVGALTNPLLADLHALVVELGMAALVEVHNEAELERALKIHPKLIGINNRDLKSFQVNLDTTARLAQLLAPEVILVAESGIRRTGDVRRMGGFGAHAVLVGEGLVTARDVAGRVRSFSGQPRRERRDTPGSRFAPTPGL